MRRSTHCLCRRLALPRPPQTRNLLKAGYQVVVWNRNPDKCAALAAEGAKVGGILCANDRRRTTQHSYAHLLPQTQSHTCYCIRPCRYAHTHTQSHAHPQVASTPQEVAAAATYTFAMLSDPEAALDVANRPDGVAAGGARGGRAGGRVPSAGGRDSRHSLTCPRFVWVHA